MYGENIGRCEKTRRNIINMLFLPPNDYVDFVRADIN